MIHSPGEIWNACAKVLADNPEPLEVSRVASATGLPDGTVISTLIRQATDGRSVAFRYPPHPCAAILKMDGPRVPEKAGCGSAGCSYFLPWTHRVG